MSDYERHKGSIEKILCDNLEEFVKNLIDTELPEYYDNYDEVFDEVNLKITEPSELEWKEDIEEISYSGDFWYALTNCYIDLDELLVDNQAKEKLKEAMLRDFSKEDRSNIIKDIDEYKCILGNEEVSTEVIALLILLYKKNK